MVKRLESAIGTVDNVAKISSLASKNSGFNSCLRSQATIMATTFLVLLTINNGYFPRHYGLPEIHGERSFLL